MENTTNQYPSEVPAQVQPHQPGDQEKMHPEPEIIKASHKGSEKLKGKVAVISGGDSGKAVQLPYYLPVKVPILLYCTLKKTKMPKLLNSLLKRKDNNVFY